ncbi:hypothetical protein ACFFTM_09900 [Pseudoduganella plicata]|uniref:DUF3828 domain-containing protein n=1 Tax=Pseudoduganella plicata TaxID=321984 RepID=A0A4P7B9T2_9BURK|nr:hypothetical protein [Pseudoduganella plicata]QBQ35134.1 hypothetical protein E1742_02320 [Pseudoduganella plicata]GGZ05625.1 hypothetical protein GCM10007388_44200 [Pseudoduganella plicata]
MRRALFAALALLVAGATTAAEALKPLHTNGEVLPNSCTRVGQAALRGKLMAPKAAVVRPEDAWRLVHTLLCAPATAQSRAYLRSHMGKTVEQLVQATGIEDETSIVAVDAGLVNSLQQKGWAWEAEIDAYPEDVTVRFWSDEASVRSRTLRFEGGMWRIVATMDASD